MACEGGACARRFDFDADAFFFFDFDREVAIMTGTAPPVRPMMMMGTGMHTPPLLDESTCMQILALTCHVKVCKCAWSREETDVHAARREPCFCCGCAFKSVLDEFEWHANASWFAL